jgi:type II secretory pathway component PulJ
VATRTLRRILLLLLGWTLIGLGIVGLALPFLQGVLMILAGLAILSRESRWVRHHVTRYRRRHPGMDRRMHEVGDWLRNAVPRRWRSIGPEDHHERLEGSDDGIDTDERTAPRTGVAVDGREWQNVPTDAAED